MIVMRWAGRDWKLSRKRISIIDNPIAPRFPTVGKVIELRGHLHLSDGGYLVTRVKEYDPPFPHHTGKDGRDIRINVVSEAGEESPGLAGENILKAMPLERF